MSRIVFLLEERSIAALLDGLLPRFFPGLRLLCVPHEEKHDLEKSIPREATRVARAGCPIRGRVRQRRLRLLPAQEWPPEALPG